MSSETPEPPDSGYPEEAPSEVVDDDAESGGGSSTEESARPGEAADRAPDHDDGTATGNNP